MKRLLLPLLAALAFPTAANANFLCTIDEIVWGKSQKLKENEQFNIIAFTSTDRLDEEGYINILNENNQKYKFEWNERDLRFFFSRTYEYENNPFEEIYEIGHLDNSGGEFKRTLKNSTYDPNSDFYNEKAFKTAKKIFRNQPRMWTDLVHKGTCKIYTYDLDKKIFYWSEMH